MKVFCLGGGNLLGEFVGGMVFRLVSFGWFVWLSEVARLFTGFDRSGRLGGSFLCVMFDGGLDCFLLGFVSSDRWSVSLSAVCLDPPRVASVTVSVARRTLQGGEGG